MLFRRHSQGTAIAAPMPRKTRPHRVDGGMLAMAPSKEEAASGHLFGEVQQNCERPDVAQAGES